MKKLLIVLAILAGLGLVGVLIYVRKQPADDD